MKILLITLFTINLLFSSTLKDLDITDDDFLKILHSSKKNLILDRINDLMLLKKSLDNVDDDFTNSITVYPNPASNFIKISNNFLNANYSIFSTLGQKLKIGKIDGTNNINISDLSAGNYILKIRFENAIYTKKIVKQ